MYISPGTKSFVIPEVKERKIRKLYEEAVPNYIRKQRCKKGNFT